MLLFKKLHIATVAVLGILTGLACDRIKPASAEQQTAADRSSSIRAVAAVALPVNWRAVDSGDYKLENDLEALYIALYNTGNLPLKIVDDRALTSQPVVNILRKQGIQFGRSFSVTLDALMCDLNPSVCTRTRRPARPSALKSSVGHVGGYLPSRGQWT